MRDNRTKIAYIAGPHLAKNAWCVQANINIASDLAAKYWLKGYAVICSHKNTAMFEGLISNEDFFKGHMEILRRCDVIILMGGWEQSEEAIAEHKEAVRLKKEIIFE